MSLTLEDVEFLKCGVCNVSPVRVYRDGIQYACDNGHFVCGMCSEDGAATCRCGCGLRAVTEPDEEFTRVAPFYVKQIVHVCDFCDFCTLDADILQVHSVLSCDRVCSAPFMTPTSVVSKQGRCVNIVADGDSIVLDAPRGVVSAIIAFKSGAKVTIDTQSRTMSMTVWNSHPMYVVARAAGHCVFATSFPEAAMFPCHLLFDDTVTVSVYPVFSKIPPNPYSERRDFSQCQDVVGRWMASLPGILSRAIQRMVLSGDDTGLPHPVFRPMGATQDKSELAVMALAGKRIFKETYTGGLMFHVPGTVPVDGSAPINGFYLYLADSSTGETSVVCPGCLNGFHFMVPTSSICEHLLVNDAYIAMHASRVDVVSGEHMSVVSMTRCMRWANAADFGREVMPQYERLRTDLMPMHGLLHVYRDTRPEALPDFFGQMHSVGGRRRLVSVYLEQPDTTAPVFEDEFDEMQDERPRILKCAFCNDCIATLPMRAMDAFVKIGSHYGLHPDFVSTFSRILFDRTLTSYKLRHGDMFVDINLLN